MRIPLRIALSRRSGILPSILLLFCSGVFGSATAHAQQWTPPTQEELSMTSQPQVPGAPAVYLYREETADDLMHAQSFYVRLKVLTEAGKAFANVKMFGSDIEVDDAYSDYNVSVIDVAGRTIHSDGTIIPFTGKPFEQTAEKAKGVKITEKVFTLPDVEVGSILEYRYKLSISDDWMTSPTWFIQQNLFLRKGYFYWKSLDVEVMNEMTGQISQGIAYSSSLPNGTAVKMSSVPETGGSRAFHRFELTVHDIPPVPREQYMPPLRSLSYRVNFYFAYYSSAQEFWKEEGKGWAKTRERFLGPQNNLADAVNTIVAPGDSDTVKLQKIYAAVMAMDNTTFSRGHARSEDKAQGLTPIKTTQDIWLRKRGSGDQLTLLFISMARAAGLKAYVMRVTSRDTNIFSPGWLTLRQLNDYLAVVMLDGKEQFFDPGERDCPFGQMAWKHTGVSGLREMADGSTTIATTPEPPYTLSTTQRIADLTLDNDGTVSGTIQISWSGAPALDMRQIALRRDEEGMRRSMREWVQQRIPKGLALKISTVENIGDYEKPLVANFSVHGPLASMTAKRFILPSQFFEVNSKPLFPHPTRDIAIYFQHGGRTIDAYRVKLPPEMKVESVPKDDSFLMQKLASYHAKPEVAGDVVLMRRTFILGVPFFMPKEYQDVRTFYDKVAVDDQQPIVLLGGTTAAAPAVPATETKESNDKSN